MRTALLLALYGALIWQTLRYQGGVIFYGEYIHWTGLQAVHLLLVTLAITPLRRIFPQARWAVQLVTLRRNLGIAVFVFALAHTIAYLTRQPGIHEIVEEARTAGMLTGWLALLVFLPLALTSNDRSLRTLKGFWKTLHRLVFVGAFLTVAHWILTAFDPTTAYVYMAVLLVLVALRAIGSPGTVTQGPS